MISTLWILAVFTAFLNAPYRANTEQIGNNSGFDKGLNGNCYNLVSPCKNNEIDMDDLWIEQIINFDSDTRFVICSVPDINKYGTEVTSFFLSDQFGRQANKQIFDDKQQIVLHGVWPTDICYLKNNKEKKINMKLINSTTYNSIINDIHKCINNQDIDEFFGKIAKSKEQFYYNEYKKHFYSNGYSVNVFCNVIIKAISNFVTGKWNRFYPHEFRVNKTDKNNYLEQIVYIAHPENVKFWNYEQFNRQSDTFVNTINGNEIINIPFCFNHDGSNDCYTNFFENFDSIRHLFIDGNINKVLDLNMVRVFVNKYDSVMYNFKQGNWQYFLGQISTVFMSGGTLAVQYIKKIKSEDLNVNIDIPLDFYSRCLMFIGFISVCIIILLLLSYNFMDIIGELFMITILGWLLNCCLNIVLKFNTRKTIISICFGIFVWLCINLIVFNDLFVNSYDMYITSSGTSAEKIEILREIGFENSAHITHYIINKEINLELIYWYFTYIIMPTIMIGSYFRKIITYVLTCNESIQLDNDEKKSILYTCLIHIFSIIILMGVLVLNYDIHSSCFRANILDMLKNSGFHETLRYISIEVSDDENDMFNWLNMDNFATNPAYVLGIFLLITLSIELIGDLVLRRFKFIRVSEIALFLFTFIYQFNNILSLGKMLYLSLRYNEISNYMTLLNYGILLLVAMLAQLWSQSTSIFFLASEFLVILPLIIRISQNEFFGIKTGIEKLLTAIDCKDCFIELYLLMTLCVVLYITHVSFKLPKFHRYITINREFKNERAWKKSFLKIGATTLKCFTSLILIGYFTQFILPFTNSRIMMASSLWFIIMIISIFIWSILVLISVFSSLSLVYKTKFGSYYYVKLMVYSIIGLCFLITITIEIVMIISVFNHYSQIYTMLNLVTQLIPNFFIIVIIAYVQAWLSPISTRLIYWISTFQSNNVVLGCVSWLKSALLSVLNLWQWVCFSTFIYKSGIIFYHLYNNVGGSWYNVVNNFFGIWCSLAFVLIAVDLQSDLVKNLMKVALAGLKFKKYIKYQRDPELIKDIKKKTDLDEKINIEGKDVSIWEFLTASAKCDVATRRSVSVSPSIKTYTKGINGEVNGGEANQFIDLGDEVMGINAKPTNFSFSSKLDPGHVRENTDYVRVSETDDAFSLLSGLNLIKETTFQDCGSYYCLEDVRQELADKFTEIVDEVNHFKIDKLTEQPTVYWPSYPSLESRFNAQKIVNSVQALTARLPVYATAVADIVHKLGTLTKPEYCDIETILVEQDVNIDMEIFQLIPNTPFGIVRNLMNSIFGVASVNYSDRTVQEAAPQSVYCSNLEQFCQSEIDYHDDNIYTLQEYIMKTGFNFDTIWSLVQGQKIWITCNNMGRVYVTTSPQVGAQMNNAEIYGAPTVKLENMVAEKLEEIMYVKPFIITSHHTMASWSNPNAFSIKWDKHTKILKNDGLTFFISGAMDLSEYVGINIRENLTKDTILQKTLAFSTGLVYQRVKGELKEHHSGSCSVVKHPKSNELYILTNKHIGSEITDFDWVTSNLPGAQKVDVINEDGKIERKTMRYRDNLVCALGLEKKTILIPMKKLVAMGFDYCLFKLDNKIKNNYIEVLSKLLDKTKDETWKHVPVIGNFSKDSHIEKNSVKGVCMLSSVRQTDRSNDKNKSIVQLRMALLRWHIGDKLWEMMGYATPGMSGSPLWQMEEVNCETGNYYRLVQVGLVSAVERNSSLLVHMTNFILARDLTSMLCSKGYKDNGEVIQCPKEFYAKGASVRCRTSRMQDIDKTIKDLKWQCSLQDVEPINLKQQINSTLFSTNSDVDFKFDQLFCQGSENCKSLRSHLKNPKLSPYWQLYDEFGDHLNYTSFHPSIWEEIEHELADDHDMQRLDINDSLMPSEIVRNSVLFEETWRYTDVLKKFKSAYDTKKNIIVRFYNGCSYIFVHWKNRDILPGFIQIPEGTFGFFSGCYDKDTNEFYLTRIHDKIPVLLTEPGFVVEVIRACHWYVSIEGWLNQLQSIAQEGEEIVSINKIDNSYYIDLYRKINGTLHKTQTVESYDEIVGKVGIYFETDKSNLINLGIPTFNGFFVATDNQNIADELNYLAQDMIAIRDQEKQANQSIQRIRNLIQDYKQSEDYMTRRQKWEKAIKKYNEDRLNHAQDIAAMQKKMKEISAELRDIDLEYANKIKKIKVKKQNLDESKKVVKQQEIDKNKKKIDRLNQDIENLEKRIKEEKERLEALKAKRKSYKVTDIATIKKIDLQIQQLNDEIQSCETDKLNKKETLIKQRMELEKNMPHIVKPSPEDNPENDAKFKELMNELSKARTEIRSLQQSKDKLQGKIDNLTKQFKDSQTNMESLKTTISTLKKEIEIERSFRTKKSASDNKIEKENKGTTVDDKSFESVSDGQPKPQRNRRRSRSIEAPKTKTIVSWANEVESDQEEIHDSVVSEVRRKNKKQQRIQEDQYEEKEIDIDHEVIEDQSSQNDDKNFKKYKYTAVSNKFIKPSTSDQFEKESKRKIETSKSRRVATEVANECEVVELKDIDLQEWINQNVTENQKIYLSMFNKLKGVLTFYHIRGRLPDKNNKDEDKWSIFWMLNSRLKPTKKIVIYLDSKSNVSLLLDILKKTYHKTFEKDFRLPQLYQRKYESLLKDEVLPVKYTSNVFEVYRRLSFEVEQAGAENSERKEIRLAASLGDNNEFELQSATCEDSDTHMWVKYKKGSIVPPYIKELFMKTAAMTDDSLFLKKTSNTNQLGMHVVMSVPKTWLESLNTVISNGTFLGYIQRRRNLKF